MDAFATATRDHRAYFIDALLAAAWQLDLPALLVEPMAARDVALRLGVNPRRLSIVLDALPLTGAFAADGDRVCVVGAPPRPVVAPHGWGLLADVIRADAPVEPHEHVGEHHACLARSAHLDVVVGALTGARLLDVGGGNGAVARRFLEAGGHRATVVELPHVLPLVPPMAGLDVVEGPLSRARGLPRVDVALISHVLHHHDPSAAASIVADAAGCLDEGGRLVVRETRADTDVGLLFSVNLALYAQAGQVYGEQAILSWCRSAGLSDVQVSKLGDSEVLFVAHTR